MAWIVVEHDRRAQGRGEYKGRGWDEVAGSHVGDWDGVRVVVRFASGGLNRG